MSIVHDKNVVKSLGQLQKHLVDVKLSINFVEKVATAF